MNETEALIARVLARGHAGAADQPERGLVRCNWQRSFQRIVGWRYGFVPAQPKFTERNLHAFGSGNCRRFCDTDVDDKRSGGAVRFGQRPDGHCHQSGGNCERRAGSKRLCRQSERQIGRFVWRIGHQRKLGWRLRRVFSKSKHAECNVHTDSGRSQRRFRHVDLNHQ